MDERVCEYCGKPLPPGTRSNQRYCGRTHKRQARRQAKRREEIQERLVTRYPPYADVSLTEQYERAREHRASLDPGEDLRQYSDYGQVPGDLDEQTARVHAMIRADEARRAPRRPWSALKRLYNANPGVELPDITQERTERYQAQERAVKARLRSSTMQPQDRFNDVTRDAVATRATTSRRLNKARATADPRPVSQRQSYSFEGEQATWDAYRGGRARGQQSRHSGYQWDMQDGWTY